MKRLLKLLSLGIAACAILGFTLGVFLNANSVAAVSVTLREGRQEPKDLVLPGMAKESAAPDYRLLLRAKSEWIDCGTFQDTHIGTGLTWNVPETVPTRALAEYKLLESDRGFDELVDQVPASAKVVSGKTCIFSQSHRFDLDAGFIWFMGHPLGRIIGLTFAVMLGLYIFAQVAM